MGGTPSRFYTLLGQEAVVLFFLITAFLFWSKALAKEGRIDVASLYYSRVLRLGPLFLFSGFVVTAIALAKSHFSVAHPSQVANEVLPWLTLGMVLPADSINGVGLIPVNAGVTWTLTYEWRFYLALPLAAVFLSGARLRFFAIPLVLSVLLSSADRLYWEIFLFGICAAHVVRRYPSLPLLSRPLMAVVPLACFAGIYLLGATPYDYPLLRVAVSLLAFLCFVYGNDLLGLLRTPGARLLGTVSYSIYLLHGIVLYVVLHTAHHFRPVGQWGASVFWLLIMGAGMLVVITASVTYRVFEHPFLRTSQPSTAKQAPAAPLVPPGQATGQPALVDRVM